MSNYLITTDRTYYSRYTLVNEKLIEHKPKCLYGAVATNVETGQKYHLMCNVSSRYKALKLGLKNIKLLEQ